ncbi:MAG TPA: hydroxyacid dehydrogenase [Calditrichia bacterium]|nr:hydroxyacid dehydrogenase [Calditrichia bacterium]
MNILISDKSSPRCAEILRQAGHQVDEKNGLSPDELKNIIGEYHGLIIRSATRVTAELLQAAGNLKVVGRAGTGVDNVDLAAASAAGVVVMNTPGGNSNAVAEMVLGHMLMLARHLARANQSLKEKKWEKKLLKGSEIEGKTLGLMGYGRVSRLLAKKAKALGMEVLCFDPKLAKNFTDEEGLAVCASEIDVLTRADYLSIHLTRRTDTLNFISKSRLDRMKKGAYLINCARGGIVDETALLESLENNHLAGAALDVFENEPPLDFRLVQHERVVCTPHIAASTVEAQEKVAVMVAEQFIDFFAGKTVRNQVN